MVSINGLVYIIIGACISVASWLIDRSTDGNKLTLFIFAGMVMVLVGFIKLAFSHREKKAIAARQHKTLPVRDAGQHSHSQHPPLTQAASSAHQAQHQRQLHQEDDNAQRDSAQQQHVHATAAQHKQPPAQGQQLQSTHPTHHAIHQTAQHSLQHPHQHPHHQAHHTPPPVIVCPYCNKRQYRTSDECFFCRKRLA